MSGLVRVERGRVSALTLVRPERRNALNGEMLDELVAALGALGADEEVRCILLHGEGEHFCAGADLDAVATGAERGGRYADVFEGMLVAIEACPVPVIAKVRGAALGAGCQILAAVDLSVATEDARIGIPSARLGILLDLEKIERMLQAVGLTRARELLLTGRAISGTEAAAWGLVTRAVPAAELEAATAQLCEEVASSAPLSVRGSKAGIRRILERSSLDHTRDAALFAEHDADALRAMTSHDVREGLAAARERREPRFTGD